RPEATRENKEIAIPRQRTLFAFAQHILPQFMLGLVRSEIPKAIQENVPTPGNHQESPANFACLLNGIREITEQNNVGIDVTQHVLLCRFLRLSEQVTQQRRAVPCATHFRDVLKSQFPADLFCSGLITEEKNFRPWAQHRPACDGIPLDDSDVFLERLRRGKNRQHSGSYLALDVTSTRRSAGPPNPRQT